MSEPTICKEQSKPSKRRASPEQGCSSLPEKAAKVQEDTEELPLDSSGCGNGGAAQTGGPIGAGGKRAHEESETYAETKEHQNKKACMKNDITPGLSENTDAYPTTSSGRAGPAAVGDAGESERPMDAAVAGASGRGSVLLIGPGHAVSQQQSDWAAMAAAEALASLTRGDEGQESTGKQADIKKNGKRPGKRDSKASGLMDSPKAGVGSKTRAAAADSSTSLPEGGAALDRATADRDTEEEEDDESLLSSSTPDFSSGSEDGNAEDSECAIVSVKMAPETRQAVAQLARLQMQLETLERERRQAAPAPGASAEQAAASAPGPAWRYHQRHPRILGDSKKEREGDLQNELLNHPQLSGHIDENDEDALSYMTNLEIENNGLGYRIGFHFRRNPYFQNSTIIKERNLAMGGSPMSFSNPILWHRGQNLTARGRLVKGPNAFDPYQSFFAWFSDHSSPDRDEIAEILKNDLYRNPLRYYLTPLWEPRVNGSVPRVTNHSNSSECVVISDSEDDVEDDDDDDDDDEEEGVPDASRGEHEQEAERSSEEEDEEVLIDGSEEDEDGELEEEDGVGQQKEDEEELDVEEVEGVEGSGSTEQEEEGDIEINGPSVSDWLPYWGIRGALGGGGESGALGQNWALIGRSGGRVSLQCSALNSEDTGHMAASVPGDTGQRRGETARNGCQVPKGTEQSVFQRRLERRGLAAVRTLDGEPLEPHPVPKPQRIRGPGQEEIGGFPSASDERRSGDLTAMVSRWMRSLQTTQKGATKAPPPQGEAMTSSGVFTAPLL
ncbi:hypothetical protein AAFF_G00334350 [Aldrovandia affinis]|uniref:Uncharacterized protein n=1 Tax=Aldrovandia affinis TaxID=143900 RepID=A0AAD7SM75_9TELE|nr:hypothetical protein AAFF_G00334350 [Aldrovandia affinis]